MAFTEQEREERRRTLGASDVAAVVGMNPWKTQHDVWLEKMGLADDQNDIRTRAGELVEPVALQLYCEETGASVASFGTIVHPRHPWMSATPDFAVFGRRVVGEAKFVGWRVAPHWGSGPEDVPDYYRPQGEWQMEVCDADECHFAALVGGPDFRRYTVKRDRDLAGLLVEICGKFWRDNVVARKAPSVDGSENAREMLKKLFPRDTTPLKPATPEVEEIARLLVGAKRSRMAAEAYEATLENRLREAIGDGAGFFSDGWVATWKTAKNGVRPLKFKVKGEEAA